MDINEKIALYEFCREMSGEEYHNLTMARKKTVKRLYYKTKTAAEEKSVSNEKRIFQVNWLADAKKILPTSDILSLEKLIP
jgi:hypothetical protein